MTEPATAGPTEGSDPATENRGSSSSSVAAETGEDTESATGRTTVASPTDTVVTVSITSRVVRTTTSAISASIVPQESGSSGPIVSTLSTTSWSSSVTLSSSLDEATNQPSSPVFSSSSSFKTYTYTSPRSPFPEASTSESTDFTGNPGDPRASSTSSETQGNDSAKLPFTTSGPSSGWTTVTAGSGSSSAPYHNSTSGAWITQTVVSSLFGTAITVEDSRTSNSSQNGSVNTVVKTLTLTIGYSGALSSVRSTDVGNSRTSVDGDPGTPSTTSSRSSGEPPLSTASDSTFSEHWTAGKSQFITRTITLTPSASSDLAATTPSGLEHGSSWAAGSSSARFPLSWNSTVLQPTAGGSGWTRGVASTWTNSTRVGTHNATVVKTLTRSIVLTLTQVPGFTTAEGSQSTLWNEATAQSTTRASSTASVTDSTKVASGAMNLTRVIFSKVTLTLESATTEILTTITVGPSSATSASSTASSGQGEAVPTDGGSTDGTSETTGKSTRWSTSMQTDGTCTDGLPLSYSSSEGIESTTSCSAVVSGMETVTQCANPATTASQTAATAAPGSCASSMCRESDTDDVLSTTWISKAAPTERARGLADKDNLTGSLSLVQPTTFETWVTKREASLESQLRDGPRSEGGPQTRSPRGRDSPVHRHLNVTELGDSIGQPRWVSKVAGRLKALLL